MDSSLQRPGDGTEAAGGRAGRIRTLLAASGLVLIGALAYLGLDREHRHSASAAGGTPAPDPAGPEHAHEHSDASAKGVVAVGIGLAVTGALILLIMWGLLSYFSSRETRPGQPLSPLAVERHVPPEPRLQTSPHADLRALRAREDKVLQGYGWIDAKAGVTHIPIARAMELLAAKGISVGGTVQRTSP